MTKVLLGSSMPMLTKEGVVELHKLKHDHTYFYVLSGVNGLLYEVSEGEYYAEEPYPEEAPYNREKATRFVSQRKEPAQYFVSHNLVEDGTSITTLDTKTVRSFFFEHDWMCLTQDETRIDKDVIDLYHKDSLKYFNIDKKDELRLVEIPDDVKWFVASSDCGNEWVQEIARTWS